MGLFKKLVGDTSNFFKKTGAQAGNMFKKTSDFVTKAADQTASGIVKGANVVGGGLKQAGNVLEKAAPIAAEIGGGIAMLAGQPELAVPLMAAGAAAQTAGRQIKNTGKDIRSGGQMVQGQIRDKTSGFSATLATANAQLQDANRSLTNRLDAASQPQVTNGLAQIHSDLVAQ
jgi:hypothetical protein